MLDHLQSMAAEVNSFPLVNPPPDPIPTPPLTKKKRKLPGTPDPEAEVIALSPRTLLATNRFVCEICGKGFQRDQNLQLHRRGHNLPWKLKQKSKEAAPRKRVYVCPEKSCVHHHPSRALGDLTGIRKHFCRKHGEKKWKCDKCSKSYAMQSDWKTHSKTCGTREHRCDCGIIFSRWNSFISHRAYCDVLAEEAARMSAASGIAHSLQPPFNNLMNYQFQFPGGGLMRPNAMAPHFPSYFNPITAADYHHECGMLTMQHSMNLSTLYGSDQLALLSNAGQLRSGELTTMSSLQTSCSAKEIDSSNSLLLETTVPSLFSAQDRRCPASTADLSATALLQRAAQIGAASSNPIPVHMPQEASRLGVGMLSSGHGSSSIEDGPFVMWSAQHRNFRKKGASVGGETKDFLDHAGGQTLRSSSSCHTTELKAIN